MTSSLLVHVQQLALLITPYLFTFFKFLSCAGPRGVPFLGSLPFISYWHKSKRAYEGLTELHTQYGPVIGFCIGPQPVVSFGGSQACKEALQIESLNGRPDSAPARMKSRGKRMGGINHGLAFCIYDDFNQSNFPRSHVGGWRVLVHSEAVHPAMFA